MNTTYNVLNRLIDKNNSNNPYDGFYHTYHVKQERETFTQVSSPEEADYSFFGDWCHNAESCKIKEQMSHISGGTILDAGACDGFFSLMFSSIGASVTSMDLTDREPRSLMHILLGVEDNFHHDNIYRYGKTGNKFDFVWCQDVLCHLQHPILAIQNLRQVCSNKLYLGIDRFKTETPEIEYLYQKESGTWSESRIEDISKSAAHFCDDTYTYAYTEDFIIRQLEFNGFKNPHIKFSYHSKGANTMSGCGDRIIDVYEAEVDSEYKNILPATNQIDYVADKNYEKTF